MAVVDAEIAVAGPNARDLIARDEQVLSPSYTRSYPLVVHRAHGAVVEDVDGREYLDFCAGVGVTSTGHTHERVIEAIKTQLGRFLHVAGTDFYYDVQVELAEQLAALAPVDGPARVLLCNSGTEAVEAAIKLAKWTTGRAHILAFLGGFHGRTMGALSLTASKVRQRQGFGPLMAGVHHAPYANCYRCPVGRNPRTCDAECLDYIEDQLFKHLVDPEDVAAAVVEAVQGEGGYLVPPPQFIRRLRALTAEHRILLVLDEVQSGMGRTGCMFAIEHFGVAADVIALAKGIASGLPLGAVIAKAPLMSWPPGAHASTFGGNPVSCAAALATIELLQKELIKNAAAVGSYCLERLEWLKERHPLIGDVRGLGLMLGIELVKSRVSKEPAPAERDAILTAAFGRGVLLLGAGESVIRLSPPLIISRGQIDVVVDVLDECLAEVEGSRAT